MCHTLLNGKYLSQKEEKRENNQHNTIPDMLKEDLVHLHNDDKSDISVGIVPVNLLLNNYINHKSVKVPISVDIVPLKWLLSKSNCCRLFAVK